MNFSGFFFKFPTKILKIDNLLERHVHQKKTTVNFVQNIVVML